jgi:hypothetical protein
MQQLHNINKSAEKPNLYSGKIQYLSIRLNGLLYSDNQPFIGRLDADILALGKTKFLQPLALDSDIRYGHAFPAGLLIGF